MATKWELTKEKAAADILNAAVAEFTEKGYRGATIRSIAARAGVSNGLAGKYFGSKEDLLHTLLRGVSLEEIFRDVNETEPYAVFSIYMNFIRELQKNRPDRFRFILFVINDADLPPSIVESSRRHFSGSLMEKTIRKAQADGELIGGDAYEVFRLFFRSLYTLLDQYAALGAEAPDNDAILNILGYNRREKVYRKQEAKLENLETDLHLLLSTIRRTYPLSIFINLTKNNYHMIDYDNFTTRKAAPEGVFDELIECGASTIPDESDRRKFRDLFCREHLLKAYENGEKEHSLVHLQTGDDGIDRWMSTRCIMTENSAGEILAVSIAGTVDDAVRRETAMLHESERETLRELLLEAERKSNGTVPATAEEVLSAAKAANEAKTNFIFNMSHDMRTPMNAILGYTSMAMKHLGDREKVADCLEKTQQSGNLLLALINSVLDVSTIESGHVGSEESAGDVYFSFVNIESALRDMAEMKDIELGFAFGEIKDRFVYADFDRCVRIFTNLISNAIKYTGSGGRVSVRCEQVASDRDGYASFRYTVEDNGIGMSEEFQRQMFDAFTRERSSTVSGIQGTGLGLFACKTLVDHLGGTISCESALGKGTKFTVVLPFRIQEGEIYTDPITGETKQSGRETPAAPVDFRGRKVLLVEDNELNREIARDILEEEGLLVEEAEDGSVAVERMKEKGPDYYDFILMDIQMPVMNGYEATRVIRKLYPDAAFPIVALSANSAAQDKAASLAAGMNDHIAKPVEVKALFAALSKYI